MSKKGLKRPLIGLMDKFLVKSVSSYDITCSAPDSTTVSSTVAETDQLPPLKKPRDRHRQSGFNIDWKSEFPWVQEWENGKSQLIYLTINLKFM